MSPRTSCPSCGSAQVEPFMDYPGHQVDYFCCLTCRHIWNVPKGLDGPVNHVTPPRLRPAKMAGQAETMQDLFARADRALMVRRTLAAQYVALEREAIELARGMWLPRARRLAAA